MRPEIPDSKMWVIVHFPDERIETVLFSKQFVFVGFKFGTYRTPYIYEYCPYDYIILPVAAQIIEMLEDKSEVWVE